MMSRALGKQDFDSVRKSSALGFWCAVFCGILFSLLTGIFNTPLLNLLGADEITFSATKDYVFYTSVCGAVPAITSMVTAYLFRAEGSSLHASIGLTGGCLLNIIIDPFFILPAEIIPFGMGMGAAGAGFATLLANIFSCVYFLVLVLYFLVVVLALFAVVLVALGFGFALVVVAVVRSVAFVPKPSCSAFRHREDCF